MIDNGLTNSTFWLEALLFLYFLILNADYFKIKQIISTFA